MQRFSSHSPSTWAALLCGALHVFGPQAFAAEAPAALKTALASASQGSVVGLAGLNAAYLQDIPNLTRTWSGPKLFFSDSPESPKGSGNLYIDSFAANTPVRCYLYHANGATTNKKFNLVVRNLGTATATVQRTKAGLAGPTTNYIYAGKVCTQRYMQSTGLSSLTVAPNQCVVLDSSMNAITAAPGQLVHGIYDIQANQPIKVYALVTDPSTNAASVAPSLAVLARDGHDRGTFPFADKIVDAPIFTSGGMYQIKLCDNSADANAVGVDAVTGLSSTLNGNYGIMYRFHFTAYGDDGRKLGLMLNPRGGALGNAVNCAAGLTPSGTALVPPGTAYLNLQTEAGVTSKYQPSSSGSDIWMQWMPAGSSNLPAKLLITPY